MTIERKRTHAPAGSSSIYQDTDAKWHGRVTMGVRDDGTPDRRHVRGKTRAEVTKKVRQLEKERDSGRVRSAGRVWTVEQWLTHWLDNIAAHSVRYKTLVGYRTDVTRHLVPGIGAHRITKLEPEHIEKLYSNMRATGLAAGTVHHVHRTLRASLSEAVRRNHVSINAAMTAKAPRVEEEEIEPLTVEEAKRLLLAASHRRNGTRWAVALAVGLRQGETLGLQWSRVDLTTATIQVRHALQRRTWQHGCSDPHQCGEHYHKMTPCKTSCRPRMPAGARSDSRAGWSSMTSNPEPAAGPSRCHPGSSACSPSIKQPSGASVTSPATCGKNAGSCSPTPSGNRSIPEPTTGNGQSYSPKRP
jgi:hypothetical protein